MKAEKLAIDGGPKAFARYTGKIEPKIGVDEFMALAERFQFSPAALKRIRKAIGNADLPKGGPHLGRYYGSLKPSMGERYEALARKKLGVKYAFAVSSGTGALHAAFVAAGVGPGTEVICPGTGFMATAMAVTLAGGVPVFSDVDESLHLDPLKIEACLTPRTVALAPTHHWSNMADMAPILRVARRHKLKVIEDCAQAPGATYRGKYVGTLGDIGCYSISCYKIIGGGEGGLVVTNDARLFDRVRQLAEAGGLWRPDRFAPPRYEGELFPGTNYRMSELEAAVDWIQLGKLDAVCNRYRKVNRRIIRQLRTFREIRPQTINDRQGYIGYQIRFFPATFELAGRIAAALRAEGIGASHRGREHRPDWHMCGDMFPIILKTGHIPGGSVFEDPRYLRRGGRVDYRVACPVARDLYAREVAVHLDQWLSPRDCDAVAKGINKVLSAYCAPDPKGKRWI
jgi:dTDP-4-amino-4,6-dideoxygalactose transaminase